MKIKSQDSFRLLSREAPSSDFPGVCVGPWAVPIILGEAQRGDGSGLRM